MYLSLLNAPIAKNKNLLRDEQEVHKALLTCFDCKREGASILYRKDYSYDGSGIVMMVQSDIPPHETEVFSIEKCMNSDERNRKLVEGGHLFFNCRLQPTIKHNGRRIAIRKMEERGEWLYRKFHDSGSEVIDYTEYGRETISFRHNNNKGMIETFIFQGHLKITDAEKFLKLYRKGIGAGKAYGCGMLILAKE